MSDVELTARKWAWGRNKGFAPAVVQIVSMPDEEVWLSVFSQRGWDRGTSPIDVHFSREDARTVAIDLLDTLGYEVGVDLASGEMHVVQRGAAE